MGRLRTLQVSVDPLPLLASSPPSSLSLRLYYGECIQDQDSSTSQALHPRRNFRRRRSSRAPRRRNILHLSSQPSRPLPDLQISVSKLYSYSCFANHSRARTYSFTSCYAPTASQEEIFENDVRPLIDIVYTGVVSVLKFCHHNVSILIGKCADRNYIRIWRDVFRQDPYDAGDEGRARHYPKSSRGA